MAVPGSRHIGRKRGPRDRRLLAAWLGTVLILLNAVGAAVLPAAAAETDGPAPFLAGLEGGKIVLCTPAGLRVIDPATGEVDGGAPAGPSGEQGFCAFCLPMTNAGAATVATPTVLPLPAEPPHHAVRPSVAERPVLAAHARPNTARAPPAA